MNSMEELVRASMAADPNYPAGETDAMKWAIAFRLTALGENPLNKALRSFPREAGVAALDAIMVGWFANAMAAAVPMKLAGMRENPLDTRAKALHDSRQGETGWMAWDDLDDEAKLRIRGEAFAAA